MLLKITAQNLQTGRRVVVADGIRAEKVSVKRLKRGPYDQTFISYSSYGWTDPVVLLRENVWGGLFTSDRHPRATFTDPAFEVA